ncbi:MAG: cytidylyltransferase domain-containing protein [Porticoccaceae bacterium]
MKIVAIIQARMASTRLPGKVLKKINNKHLLSILISRVKLSKNIDEIVVATTNNDTDDSLCKWLEKNHINYFRGSEPDVLERFWKCSKKISADIIVRLTADDPLKDPEIIDKAIEIFIHNEPLDYVSNTINPSYPEGLDIEVFSQYALDLAYKKSTLRSEHEHVTPYIWKNPNIFKLHNFQMSPDLSGWRWTVDRPEDLEFIDSLLKLTGYDFSTGYRELIKIINENPSLKKINAGILRNEGYVKSLNEELTNEK